MERSEVVELFPSRYKFSSLPSVAIELVFVVDSPRDINILNRINFIKKVYGSV
jgi:hypothetical protein